MPPRRMRMPVRTRRVRLDGSVSVDGARLDARCRPREACQRQQKKSKWFHVAGSADGRTRPS
jgi:hypothetical protein